MKNELNFLLPAIMNDEKSNGSGLNYLLIQVSDTGKVHLTAANGYIIKRVHFFSLSECWMLPAGNYYVHRNTVKKMIKILKANSTIQWNENFVKIDDLKFDLEKDIKQHDLSKIYDKTYTTYLHCQYLAIDTILLADVIKSFPIEHKKASSRAPYKKTAVVRILFADTDYSKHFTDAIYLYSRTMQLKANELCRYEAFILPVKTNWGDD